MSCEALENAAGVLEMTSDSPGPRPAGHERPKA